MQPQIYYFKTSLVDLLQELNTQINCKLQYTLAHSSEISAHIHTLILLAAQTSP